MKAYTVVFTGHSAVLVFASSVESAIQAGMEYINYGFARLYAGKPKVRLHDLESIS